jgi:hypothetical protein
MRLGSEWNRRNFLGSLGVIAGSLMTPRKLFAWKGSGKVTGFGQSGNPYEERRNNDHPRRFHSSS